MSDSNNNNNKRRREADWSFTIHEIAPFRIIVESVNTVMPRALFKVEKKNNGNFYLCVDGNDPGYTSCISCRLELDEVYLNEDVQKEGSFSFCVDCKHVLIALESNSCQDASAVLEGHEADATVHIHIADKEQPAFFEDSQLATFVDNDNAFCLSSLEFDLILELDLSKLREVIKKAKKFHAEELRITVRVGGGTGKQRSCVTFSAKGDNLFHELKFFHDVNKDESGCLVVRAAADGEGGLSSYEDMPATFDHTFPVDKVDSFIRNLPCRMLTAKVAEGKPMMLIHNLKGASDGLSNIRFLIAPINDEA